MTREDRSTISLEENGQVADAEVVLSFNKNGILGVHYRTTDFSLQSFGDLTANV